MQTRKGAQVLVMAGTHWMLCAAGLFLIKGTQSSPPPLPCTEPCLCQKGPLVNCSSAGLSQTQRDIPSSITELDLSHNLLNSFSLLGPSWGLTNLWIGYNSLTHLSLCVERTWRGKRGRKILSHSRGRCLSWAPALQLLSAEGNQLETIPEGIGGSEFLQVLQISHNRISDLRPGDLSRNPLLRELHLQHNRISSLNPLALRDMPGLRVLDLSFNFLTTIPPSAYLALRNLNLFVEVSGNRWRCDCSLQGVRRWMAYDRDRNQKQTWSGVVCSYPSAHAGTDLLHLEDSDLTCSTAENRTGVHQDVTVDTGTDILLPCGSPNQDSTWWTPKGQLPGSQTGLLISDVTEKDVGLYVCVSGPDDAFVSIFNLRIHKTLRERGTRSLHRERLGNNPEFSSQKSDLQRTQWTQSDLVLAVCLSVFITLVVAFILGALARPLLDVLWKRYCRCCKCIKKSPAQAQSVTTAGQGPYDNKAYSDDEEDVETYRERRVTFSRHPSEIMDHNSVPYYDTVANARRGNQTGEFDIVQERDTSHPSLEVKNSSKDKKPRARDLVSSSSSQQDNRETDIKIGERHPSDVSLSKEFEPIPEPDELHGKQSSSESSHSDQERSDRDQDMDWPNDILAQRLEKEHKNNPWEPQSPTKEEDSKEQHSDWRQTIKESNLLNYELWNDSGESFEFSDVSGRSSCRDLSGSALINHPRKESEKAQNYEPLATDEREIDISSSCDSGNKPTEETANPETDAPKEDTLTTQEICPDPAVKSDLKHDFSLDEQLSDSSSDSGGEPTTYTVNESYEDEGHDDNQDPSLRFGDIKVSFAPRKAVNIEISNEGPQYLPEPEMRWTGEISTKQSLPQPSMPSDRAWVEDPPVPVHITRFDGVQFGDPLIPVYIPKFSKILGIHPPQKAKTASSKNPPPTESSSSSESDIETTENSQKLDREIPQLSHSGNILNPGDINISIAPRKALNISFPREGFQYHPELETTSPILGLSSQNAITPKETLSQHPLPAERRAGESPVYNPSFRRHLDIQSPHDIPPAAPSSPPPANSSSSSSESDEVTTINQTVREKAKFPSSSFSLAGIGVSLAPRKALNIGFSKDGIQYQSEPYYQEITAAPNSPPAAGFTSSSKIEDESNMYQKREEEETQVPESPFMPAGSDVSFAPRRALNIGLSKDKLYHPHPEVKSKLSGPGLISQTAVCINNEGFKIDTKPLSQLSLKKTQLTTAPQTPQPSGLPSSSSSSSDSENERKTQKTVEDKATVPDDTYQYPSLSPGDTPRNVSYTQTKAERKPKTTGRPESSGLGGLKVLSEMRRWSDTSTDLNVPFAPKRHHNMNFDSSDSSTDHVSQRTTTDHISPMQSSINRKDGAFEEEPKHLPTLSLSKTSRFFSTPTPTDEAGPRQSSLQIPRHRRRLVVGIQPPLTPPAVPGTPPPLSPEGEVAAGTGWRSRGQQRAMDGFGRTSMTKGEDEEKRYMGLTTAKPFGTVRPYQRSVTSETVTTTQDVEMSDSDGSDLSVAATTLHLNTHKEGSEA
ncbi:hypothetical protein UPYG_G00029510 [Umbra pygmaea]|uniref:Ig-like domain-containing protein n=1 Tax=Umbra pygmaea TaxID=75934 RepID=A0ABD0Y114_UMBPY